MTTYFYNGDLVLPADTAVSQIESIVGIVIDDDGASIRGNQGEVQYRLQVAWFSNTRGVFICFEGGNDLIEADLELRGKTGDLMVTHTSVAKALALLVDDHTEEPAP